MHIFEREALKSLYSANREARVAHFEKLLQNAENAANIGYVPPIKGMKLDLQAYKDEPALTLVTFAALQKCSHVTLERLLSSVFPEVEWSLSQMKLENLKLEKAFSPGNQVLESLKSEADRHPVKYVRDAARGKERIEGPTHFDAWMTCGQRNIFIEAKFTSDISVDTTHCTNRNQIARCIDVGLEVVNDQVDQFFFIMLTPERFQRAPGSRLYYYKMQEYRATPEAIANDIPRLKRIGKDLKFYRALGERIAFLSWEACAEAILSEPVWTSSEREWLERFYEDRRCLPCAYRT